MSTIKVTNVNPLTTGNAVNINGLAYPNAGPLSNRNLVVNGGMAVAQRGTTVSVANSGEYLVDRFAYRRQGAWGSNSFTMTQESSGAPDNFTHFLRLTQSGTAAAPPTNAQCRLATYLEGNAISSVGFGTSAAKDLTLSWYAKASIAGTYCVALTNNVVDQSYIAEYSVTTSWQRFTVTIPARTTGTWNTDNNIAFRIEFTVAGDTGGTHVGSTGWSSGNNLFTTNQLETFASTSGATFDLCGVQLEVGEVVTPFEHRSYADELARCQRYFIRVGTGNSFSGRMNGTTNADQAYSFPCEMRAAPTGSANFDTANIEYGSLGLTCNAISVADTGTHTAQIRFGSSNSGTNGHASFAKLTGTSYVDFNSEL